MENKLKNLVDNYKEITGYTLDQLFRNVDAMDQEIVDKTMPIIKEYFGEDYSDEILYELDDKLKTKYILGR